MRRLSFSIISVIAVAAIVIGINMFADARLANVRLDLTQGHIYTLSKGTKTVLRDLKENVAKSFTGLVSQVSSLIGAAADDPTMHATNIDAAWQTAVGFRRHMVGIDAALSSVTRRLNSADGMDESVDVFFAEFVGNILIRDWTKILSQNNPWRSRHHVTRAVREILGSTAAMEKATATASVNGRIAYSRWG